MPPTTRRESLKQQPKVICDVEGKCNYHDEGGTHPQCPGLCDVEGCKNHVPIDDDDAALKDSLLVVATCGCQLDVCGDHAVPTLRKLIDCAGSCSLCWEAKAS
jgi:hypothetical protein